MFIVQIDFFLLAVIVSKKKKMKFYFSLKKKLLDNDAKMQSSQKPAVCLFWSKNLKIEHWTAEYFVFVEHHKAKTLNAYACQLLAILKLLSNRNMFWVLKIPGDYWSFFWARLLKICLKLTLSPIQTMMLLSTF